MLDELRDELDAVIAMVRKRLDAAGELPERKQRALLRHVRALMHAVHSGEVTPADQHRWLIIVELLDEGQAMPPPKPKRLRRGSHLRAVD